MKNLTHQQHPISGDPSTLLPIEIGTINKFSTAVKKRETHRPKILLTEMDFFNSVFDINEFIYSYPTPIDEPVTLKHQDTTGGDHE